MMTVREIIELWPSASEMARDIGLKRGSHGTLMKLRGSIPVDYWPDLVAKAKKRGIVGVSLETLTSAHAGRPGSKPRSRARAGGE